MPVKRKKRPARRYITTAQLRRKSACHARVVDFASKFGSRVQVTVALARKEADVWPWWWVALALLSKRRYGFYASAVHRAADSCPRRARHGDWPDEALPRCHCKVKQAEAFARLYLKGR